MDISAPVLTYENRIRDTRRKFERGLQSWKKNLSRQLTLRDLLAGNNSDPRLSRKPEEDLVELTALCATHVCCTLSAYAIQLRQSQLSQSRARDELRQKASDLTQETREQKWTPALEQHWYFRGQLEQPLVSKLWSLVESEAERTVNEHIRYFWSPRAKKWREILDADEMLETREMIKQMVEATTKKKVTQSAGLPPRRQTLDEQYFVGLTDRQREVISLRFEYDLRPADIARRMGIDRKTVSGHFDAAERNIKRNQNRLRAAKDREKTTFQSHRPAE